MNKVVESRPSQQKRVATKTILYVLYPLLILALLAIVMYLAVSGVDTLRGHPGVTMGHVGQGINHAWSTVILPILQGIVVIALFPIGWKIFKHIHQYWLASQVAYSQVGVSRKTQRLMESAETLIEDARLTGKNIDLSIGEGTVNVKVITAPQSRVQVQEIDQRVIEPPPSVPQLAAPEATVHLSDEYRVPVNDVLSGRKLIVGLSGSGKSNTVGVYSEELGVLKVPMILADTEDEYRPLCIPKFLPNGMLAGASIVTPDNAYQFGQYVLQEMRQVILNLQSYEEMEDAALVMIGIIHGMRDWEEERDYRIPSEFILEEAVTWLPQNIKESPLYGTDTLNTLQGTFFNDMVRKGRKRGLGLTVVCQKIAEVDKRALQADAKILHYQNEGPDLKRYEEMGIKTDETLTLQKGDAFLFTSRVSKRRVHVRKRYSEHGANTPGLENLQRYQQTRTLSELDSELWRTSEPSNLVRPQFGARVEPVREVSGDTAVGVKSSQRDIPPELRTEIVRRYRNGEGRKKIQTELRIAGDQFWQLRDVCNEVDRERNAERA